jgi:hypothetical protein
MANTRGNKPRTGVEDELYSGRKSFGGERGLGPFKDEHVPQFENDQCLKKNSGDVPAARRATAASPHGLNPNFDVSPKRGKERR